MESFLPFRSPRTERVAALGDCESRGRRSRGRRGRRAVSTWASRRLPHGSRREGQRTSDPSTGYLCTGALGANVRIRRDDDLRLLALGEPEWTVCEPPQQPRRDKIRTAMVGLLRGYLAAQGQHTRACSVGRDLIARLLPVARPRPGDPASAVRDLLQGSMRGQRRAGRVVLSGGRMLRSGAWLPDRNTNSPGFARARPRRARAPHRCARRQHSHCRTRRFPDLTLRTEPSTPFNGDRERAPRC